MIKKFICIIMVLAMALAIIPTSAVRDEGVKFKGTPLDYDLKYDSFTVVVADAETLNPVREATVEALGQYSPADENGVATIYSQDEVVETITISAPGYKTNSVMKRLESQGYCYILLERLNDSKKPYISMAAEVNTLYDLRTQGLHYSYESELERCELKLSGDWQEHKEGSFVFIQHGQPLNNVDWDGQLYSFTPVNDMADDAPIYVKMVSADGVESDPVELKITIKRQPIVSTPRPGSQTPAPTSPGAEPETGLIEIPEQIALTEDFSGALNTNGNNLFPNTINASFPLLPITINRTTTPEGNIKLRLAINITKSVPAESNEMFWTTLKNSYTKSKDDFRKAKDEYNRLKDIQQQGYQLIDGKYELNTSWKTDINSFGYYEAIFDRNGNLASQDGGIIITGGAKYTISQQYLLGPLFIPVYVDFGIEPINLNMVWPLFYSGSDFQIPDITLGASLSAGCGVGVSRIATVGIEGKLGAKLKFKPPVKFTVDLGMSLKAYIIFILNWEYKFFGWDIFTLTADKGVPDFNGLQMDPADIKVASRDYARKTTAWNGRMKNIRPLSKNASLKSVDVDYMTSLQDWIMPNSIPKIAEHDGRQVIIFHENDLKRDAEDGVVLKYSVMEGGSWSTPRAVWDTGTSDMFARIETGVGDELYVIWQKQKDTLVKGSVEDIMEAAASQLEICVARFDGKEFVDKTMLTSNDTTDAYPVLAFDDERGTTVAVWANTDSTDILSNSGSYSIMASWETSRDNGQAVWSEPEKICSSEYPITELDAELINGELHISAVCTRGDGSTLIYEVTDNKVEYVMTEIADSEGGFAIQYKGNHLYWYKDGCVYEYDHKYQTATLINPGQANEINSSYRMLISPDYGKTAIAWTGVNGGQYGLYVSVKKGEYWGAPIKVADLMEDSVQYMDALISSDGAWKFIMNTSTDVGNEEAMHSLIFANAGERSNVTLDYVSAYDYARDNGVQPIAFRVTNSTESVLSSLQVKVFSGDTTYYQGSVPCSMKPGESQYIEMDVAIPNIGEMTEVSFTVTAINDRYPEDNTETVTLGKTDLDVKANLYTVEDNAVIVAKVANNSNITATTTVNILENDREAPPSQSSGSISIVGGRSRLYIFRMNRSLESTKALYVDAVTQELDFDAGNNYAVIMLYGGEAVNPSTGNAAGVSHRYHAVEPEIRPIDRLLWTRHNANK